MIALLVGFCLACIVHEVRPRIDEIVVDWLVYTWIGIFVAQLVEIIVWEDIFTKFLYDGVFIFCLGCLFDCFGLIQYLNNLLLGRT
jgi:hypothetical protein